MKAYFEQTTRSAIVIWSTTTIGILIAAILYISLRTVGVQESISLLIALFTLIGLIVLGLLLFQTPMRKKARRPQTQQFKSEQDQSVKESGRTSEQTAWLQKYLDQMSDLILHGRLLDSLPSNSVESLAQASTLMALDQLDVAGKASIIKFLYGVGLLTRMKTFTLMGADLRKVILSGAVLREAHLSGADLSGADLSNADLRRADLSGTDLSGTDLSGTDLSGTDLSGANLSGANLSDANLSGADLQEADLIGSRLERALLREANLHSARLQEVNLNGALLDKVDLSEAKIFRTDISEAELYQTDLSQADLEGTEEQYKGRIF